MGQPDDNCSQASDMEEVHQRLRPSQVDAHESALKVQIEKARADKAKMGKEFLRRVTGAEGWGIDGFEIDGDEIRIIGLHCKDLSTGEDLSPSLITRYRYDELKKIMLAAFGDAGWNNLFRMQSRNNDYTRRDFSMPLARFEKVLGLSEEISEVSNGIRGGTETVAASV